MSDGLTVPFALAAHCFFGSNLRLAGGKLVWGEYKNGDDWPKTQWTALSAAREKIGKISDCVIVVSLYNEVRTFFEQNY